MPASDINLADKKQATKAALESLISQCQGEIHNLERFDEDDDRMLVATADLQRAFDQAMTAADDLQIAFETVRDFDEEDTYEKNSGR